MSIVPSGELIVQFTVLLVTVMQTGLMLSYYGFVGHKITNLLSRYTRIERADPTVYIRQYEAFFNALFEPIGLSAANKVRSPWLSQLSYHTSISIAVIVIAMAIYFVTGGIAIGSVFATHVAFGVVIDPTPVFEQVAALVVLCSLSIIFHASEKAGQLAVGEQ